MSFRAEISDFVQGYGAGEDIKKGWADRKYRDLQTQELQQKIRKGRDPTDPDLSAIPDPFGSGDSPYSEGGGSPGDPRYRDAISSIESGGKYNALGPWTGDPEEGKDRAYGRYQVMGRNVPIWTRQALGKSMTPQEFLADPKAQDAVFDHVFGGYVQQFGEKGAAEAWFGGPGSVGKGDRKDVLGTTVKSYGSRFMEALAKAPRTDNTATASTDTSAPASTQERQTYASSTDDLNPKIKRVYDRAARDNPGLFAVNPFTHAGRRTPQEQQEMIDKGYSTTRKSKHLQGKAIDLVPVNPKTGKPDPDYTAGYNAIHRAMTKAAQDEGVTDLSWGGDWKSFQDRPHWQVSQLQPNAAPNADALDMGAIPDERQQPQSTMFAARGGVVPERHSPRAGIETRGVARVSPGRTAPGIETLTDEELAALLPRVRAPQVSSGSAGPEQAIPGMDSLDMEQFAQRQLLEMNAQRQMIEAEQQRRREAAQPAVAARNGGLIPAPRTPPQRFETGGQPYVPEPNPDNPSNAPGGGDKYSRFRNYTQQITPSATSASAAPRISIPTYTPPATGPSASQIAFARLIAARPVAAPAPVAAAPAPVAAKPAPVRSNPNNVPMSVVMPYGNQGGAFGFYDPTLASRIKQGRQRFAEGGMVDRDKRFNELLRQESRQRSQHTDDGGESPRDRAARRLSAQEGRPSSTAYSPEYWQKPGKGGKKGGTSLPETAPKPTPRPDNATTTAIPVPVGPGGTPTEGYELPLTPVAAGTPTEGYEPKPVGPGGTPTSAYELPVGPGGTPTQGYEPKTRITGPPDRPLPNPNRPMRHAPPSSFVVGGRPDAPIPSNRAPPAWPADPERTAADVADTRKRMELVLTPPANRLVPVLLDPATGQIHDPNDAPVRSMPGHPEVVEPDPARFGYAAGGVIPEPGETGYNEAVASGATATTPLGGDETMPQSERPRPTPRLLSDVSMALHGGVKFLTQHFGLGQDGAVPTPEGQQQADDGTRRFATGEGGMTGDEIQQIDDRVDPDRQMTEGERQMTRLAKMTQWYLQQGRKEDAAAAAAGLMQYGATRSSRLGSMAAAAYSKYLKSGNSADLENTTKFLQSAYQMVPDGGTFNISLDQRTHRIMYDKDGPDGPEPPQELDPNQLPGIIQGAQNKSLYWDSIFRLADPEGARAKDTRAHEEYTHQRSLTEEETKHARGQEEEVAKNKREEDEFYRRRDEERKYREAHPTTGGTTSVDEEAYSNAWSDADAAQRAYKTAKQNSDDPDNDPEIQRLQDEYNRAASRLADTIPFNRRSLELQRLGFENFTYMRPEGGTAAPADAAAPQSDAAPPADHPNAQFDQKSQKWIERGANGKWQVVG